MITFGLNYDVKPEFTDEFERVSLQALQAMQGVPGHRETRLYRDVQRPNSYMIYSDWETKQHFTAFLRSDAFKKVQATGRDMLENRPRHNIYTRGAMQDEA